MKMKILTQFAFTAALLLTANSAHALTVGGTQYDQILNLTTADASDRLGYWISMDKFYTYEVGVSGASAIDVNKTSSDSSLANIGFTDVLAMGTTIGHNGPVNSGGVNFYGAGGVLLLSTAFIPNGTLTSVHANGTAGQLDIEGRLSVTGGTLAGLAIFANPLYLQIAFDNVVGLGAQDLHTDTGRFTLFAATGGTQVPEPGSIALLLTGLAGLGRTRRKKALGA